MSTNTLLRGSLIAAFGFAGLAMTAEAQLRYGNVHNYESGHCGNACVPGGAVQTNASRYGQGVQQPAFSQRQFYSQPSFPVSPGPVYVDCRATGTCTPQPTTVYTQPAQTYIQPAQTTYTAPAKTFTQSFQTTTQAPAQCPAGTTPQSDGTCLQGSSFSSSTFSAPASSYGSSSSFGSTSSLPAECPAGTTPQSDGTCMESSFSSTSSFDSGSSYGSGSSYDSGSSFSSSSSASYGSGSSFGGVAPTNCPAGTIGQADGTCMESGSSSFTNDFSGSSIDLYTGDATTTSSQSYGYSSEGSYGSSNDYLPIRK